MIDLNHFLYIHVLSCSFIVPLLFLEYWEGGRHTTGGKYATPSATQGYLSQEIGPQQRIYFFVNIQVPQKIFL